MKKMLFVSMIFFVSVASYSATTLNKIDASRFIFKSGALCVFQVFDSNKPECLCSNTAERGKIYNSLNGKTVKELLSASVKSNRVLTSNEQNLCDSMVKQAKLTWLVLANGSAKDKSRPVYVGDKVVDRVDEKTVCHEQAPGYPAKYRMVTGRKGTVGRALCGVQL